MFNFVSFVNYLFMKVLKISKLFDFLFGVSFLFLISFVWIRYFFENIWLTLFLSSVLTFLIVAIFHASQKYFLNKKNMTEKDIENASGISTNFLLLKKTETLKIFEKKLGVKYNVKTKSDFLIINKNILRPIYTTSTITSKEVLETYTKTKNENFDKLIIVCKKASDEAKETTQFFGKTNCIILEEFDAYENIFKPLNFDVVIANKAKKEKRKIYDYLSFALNKQRTKNYLMISVFMLFSSFVLRYNIYYIVFASITTLLGLYSYFNKRFNSRQNTILMENL